jgi:hypothetical protein
VNLQGGDLGTITRKTENVINSSKEIVLGINVEKTKYMLLFRHQNVGQKREIVIAKRLFENMSQFKYLEVTVTNKNPIQEESKRD